MARIEQVFGSLQAADTDQKTLSLAVSGQPDNRELGYNFQADKIDLLEFLGRSVVCNVIDNIAQSIEAIESSY